MAKGLVILFSARDMIRRSLNRNEVVLLYAMNIYDKKSVRCSRCDRFIGEIDYDAVVTLPKCGRCANPMPEGDDKLQYIVTKFNKSGKNLVPTEA